MEATIVTWDNVGKLAALAGILAAIIVAYDKMDDYRVDKTKKHPKLLIRPIRERTLWREIKRIQKEYDRSLPDVIVGVHYGGMMYATKFARRFFTPLIMAYTTLERDGNGLDRCVGVLVLDAQKDIAGMRVWIIDNGIHTGRTLDMVRVAVAKLNPLDVMTVVVCNNGSVDPQVRKPDLTIFRSRRRFRHLVR